MPGSKVDVELKAEGSDIIERHKGSIWAKNNDDKGSTFYIKLPLHNGQKGEENNGTSDDN